VAEIGEQHVKPMIASFSNERLKKKILTVEKRLKIASFKAPLNIGE